MLVADALTDTTHTDTGWSSLAAGFYKYAVTAVYTDDSESASRISNWLQKANVVEVTVNVDSNLGEVLPGANVSLISQAANPAGEYDLYEGITDEAGTVILSVNNAMYDITVSAAGFLEHTGVIDASEDRLLTLL